MVISHRLERLPIARLSEIAYPVSEWMERIQDRLYGDAAHLLTGLWDRLIAALALHDGERVHRPGRSWADDALNAPVGRLVNLLMKDPAKNGLDRGAAIHDTGQPGSLNFLLYRETAVAMRL